MAARRTARSGLVVAGAEGAAGAGEDDHPHGAVGIGLVEGTVQLGFEIVGERVHPLGAIERDGRDAVLDLVEQILGSHCRFFLSWRSRALLGGVGGDARGIGSVGLDRDIDRDRAG